MIVEGTVLLTFIPAALALNLTPGADMLFCPDQGLRAGPGAALTAAGVSLGGMVHVAVAGLGLGAVAGLGLGAAVAAAPWLFEVIRWAGVAYLPWLACAPLRAGPVRRDLPAVRPRRAFCQGFAVRLTNPKAILFALAFVPQFVDAGRAVLPQFLMFGAVLGLGVGVVNGQVGVFAGGVGQRLLGSAGFGRWLGRISAGVFVALAARRAVGTRG